MIRWVHFSISWLLTASAWFDLQDDSLGIDLVTFNSFRKEMAVIGKYDLSSLEEHSYSYFNASAGRV